MDTRDLQTKLNQNGFHCGTVDGVYGSRTTGAVWRFQTAFAFYAIAIDGKVGPETEGALEKLPFLSPHFKVSELSCKHCGDTLIHRELLFALEILRGHVSPILLVDAYRCETHNAQVPGSASDSQHVDGTAADLATPVDINLVLALNAFSGIGNRGNLASHVDVRHVAPATNHTPGATPSSPARWHY